jgi:hypothetical protein
MTIQAFDLVLLPDRQDPDMLDLKVLFKTDTPDEEFNLVSLVKVRLGGEDLTPDSFSTPQDYLVAARTAAVVCLKHFTDQEEEILPFTAYDTAREVFIYLTAWS